MTSEEFDPQAILASLTKHGVDFIVVGGVSGILHGVPLMTFDLDVVYCTEDENIRRLVAALQDIDATYRDLAGRRIVPTVHHLTAAGHNLLNTVFGNFDVLGYIGAVGSERRYADLLSHSVKMNIEEDVQVNVLDLPMLITSKEEANRDKDQVALLQLRQVLMERQQREGGQA